MKQRKKVSPGNAEPREVTKAEVFDPGFEVREGDTLSVSYAGAKISIEGTYSSVELDGGYFKRTLVEGDDPVEQFERIYGFLKNRCERHARAKLMHFADQIAKAEARAKGNA